MPMNDIIPLLYTVYKDNSKWFNDINVRFKAIKLIEENIEKWLYDIRLGNNFLDMAPKSTGHKNANR